MKSASRFISRLLVMLAFWSAIPSPLAETSIAIIRFAKGDVRVLTNGVNLAVTNAEVRLNAGAVIMTGRDSQARLFLGQNGPLLWLASDTEIVFEELEYESTMFQTIVSTKLKLVKGRIKGSTRKQSRDGRYMVRFPDGEMRTYGGDFVVAAPGEVTSLNGDLLVQFAEAHGKPALECKLPEGFSTSREVVKKLSIADQTRLSRKIDPPSEPSSFGDSPPSAFPEPNFPRRKGL